MQKIAVWSILNFIYVKLDNRLDLTIICISCARQRAISTEKGSDKWAFCSWQGEEDWWILLFAYLVHPVLACLCVCAYCLPYMFVIEVWIIRLYYYLIRFLLTLMFLTIICLWFLYVAWILVELEKGDIFYSILPSFNMKNSIY